MATVAEFFDALLDVPAGWVGMDSPMWLAQLVAWVSLSVTVFSLVLTTGGLFTFVFRRMFAFFTQRIGPNRVGPFGILQLVADGLKLVAKEDIIPARVDRPLFRMAPYLAVTPFVLAFAPIPWTQTLIFGNVATGIFFILAISAIAPLSEITAGWASNNKYAIYGGVRAAALDFSYEIPMILSAIAVVLLAGSASTVDIVMAQEGLWFFVPMFIGMFIFFVAALAKAGLVPTDLPEAESELVAGFTTEYSGMRFGMFYVVLFANVLFIAALITTLFLGGWLSPLGNLQGAVLEFGVTQWAVPGWLASVLGDGLVWFLLKTVFICFTIFWLWLTVPRVRVDQYLNLAWKVMFPLALINLVIAGLVRWYVLG